MNQKSKSEILSEAARMHPVITNPTATGMNVVTKEEYTELATFVFGRIVDVLSKSYGPYGSMTLINRAGRRFSTKDGWRILMHTQFESDRYYHAIRQMIFEVCSQMNNTVGDGTTTVILIANRIYQELVRYKDEMDALDLPPRDIFKAFDHIVSVITEKLKTYAREITPEDIRHIARIATNDDTVITNALCDLYDRNPNADIQIMESNKIGVSIDKCEGLKIPLMLLDRIYINNNIEKRCMVDNALYLVFNHKVAQDAINNIILPVEQYVRTLRRRLVVIAPAYDEKMLVEFWVKKTADEVRATNTTTTILTHYKSTILGVDGASDLAILLDTTPIDARIVEALSTKASKVGSYEKTNRVAIVNYENTLDVILGQCDHASIGLENQSFLSGLHPVESLLEKQKGEVKAAIDGLEDTMTVTERSSSMKLAELKRRYARLEMKMNIIYYGADSDFDKEMMHDTIDDGVRALESAKNHGVIRGSQYDMLRACREILATDLSKIEKIIVDSMITGIQTMLTKDLYGKSIAYRLAVDKDDSTDQTNYSEDVLSRKKKCEDAMAAGLDKILNSKDSDVPQIDALNIITMESDPTLVTSAETDMCALKAAIELIKILIAGNQLLMLND